ncbi:MAG: glutamate decarboxylase, partial [Actinomycetes bacterium]
PVFAFALAPSVTKYTVYDISRSLRERGWLVPAYTMPPKREDLAVLRLVIRHGFSHDVGDLFLKDLQAAVTWLDNLNGPMPVEEKPNSFRH